MYASKRKIPSPEIGANDIQPPSHQGGLICINYICLSHMSETFIIAV